MGFEDNRRNRRVELICECREVRFDRDDRHRCDRDHDRHRGHHDDHCGCNRRRRNFWW